MPFSFSKYIICFLCDKDSKLGSRYFDTKKVFQRTKVLHQEFFKTNNDVMPLVHLACISYASFVTKIPSLDRDTSIPRKYFKGPRSFIKNSSRQIMMLCL
ncbi:unnamed protein product [Malus baccata var. baccata]